VRRQCVALGVVFRDPFNVALAVVVACGTEFMLLWSGQLIAFPAAGGPYLDLDAARLAAVTGIAGLVAIAAPLHLELIRRVRSRRAAMRGGSTMLIGSASAIAAISCCSPILVPTVAGLLGVSGSSLIGLNLALHRWFVPVASLAALVIGGSAVLALREFTRECMLPSAPRDQMERANGATREST
jgi:hypothetical protein